MLKEGGIQAGEDKEWRGGGGGCSLSVQEEKAVQPSQFPKASLLKHSLPQGEEKEGESRKKKKLWGGEETEIDGRDD